MDRYTPRLSTVAALELNEEYVQTLSGQKKFLDQRLNDPKCQVEFVLDRK